MVSRYSLRATTSSSAETASTLKTPRVAVRNYRLGGSGGRKPGEELIDPVRRETRLRASRGKAFGAVFEGGSQHRPLCSGIGPHKPAWLDVERPSHRNSVRATNESRTTNHPRDGKTARRVTLPHAGPGERALSPS